MNVKMNDTTKKILDDSVNALKNVREKNPLTHCITNYVTINDCANAVLAIGGSPMMADDPEEVEEFVKITDNLVINIGKMSQTQIEAMKIGSKYATKINVPIVLDPVAVGVTELRNNLTIKLIKESNLSAIRGNMSEIKAIARLINLKEIKSSKIHKNKGVDVSEGDETTNQNLKINGNLVKALANKCKTVIVASGQIDLISDGKIILACENGDKIMPKITGSGCMLSSILGTFCGANDPLNGAITATIAMGIAGEKAGKYVNNEKSGTGTFRTKLIDYLYTLDEKTIRQDAKIYEVTI